jgi:16S rRNA (guanine527-N7)-methyltransferase
MSEEGDLQRALGQGAALTSVSIARLHQFEALVRKWNPSINIVARSTLEDLWHRHIMDSVQLFSCVRPNYRLWLDIGSGGGFPGIVIAILAAGLAPQLRIALVESDKRKSVFLSEAVRQLELSATIYPLRIDELAPQGADVVSARALAPLTTLCGLSVRHLRDDGVCAFLKGANADTEIIEARKDWRFDLDRTASITDSRASALFLRGLRHV